MNLGRTNARFGCTVGFMRYIYFPTFRVSDAHRIARYTATRSRPGFEKTNMPLGVLVGVVMIGKTASFEL